MFDSPENAERSFGFLIIGILALFCAAVWSSNVGNENAAGYYYQRCADSGGYRAPVTQSPQGDQVSNQAQWQSDYQPDWCDLAAQESVAQSTRGAERAAWLSVFLTGIGVLLLIRTLQATRDTVRAADDANKILRSEHRPWLDFEITEPGTLHSTAPGYVVISPEVSVTNYGKAPATNVSVHTRIIMGFSTVEPDRIFGEILDQKGFPFAHPTIFPNGEAVKDTMVRGMPSHEPITAQEQAHTMGTFFIAMSYDVPGQGRGHVCRWYVINIGEPAQFNGHEVTYISMFRFGSWHK